MMVTYKEKDLLGGYSIEVLVGNVPVGSIRRHGASPNFSYFEGAANQLTPSLSDLPLDVLKRQLEQRLKR